ncbi:hypothetical protein Ocin01_15123 [Orchesella cincta]|uniref:Uncharacterized protein n=1 Tax=Orchesella cincta TaxID=48709 RepID=A0A1D2MF88_ORCCI|nr:hypothetical protein Ocin01_15123 [Orchesella cincta]
MRVSKPLLILLVVIGVIYCAHFGYAQSLGLETEGGCEEFCSSCTKGDPFTPKMLDCNCCLPKPRGEAQGVAPSQSKFGTTRDDDDDDDQSQDR